MPNLVAGAASWLLGDNAGNIGNSDVRLLLEALGYATATQFSSGSGGADREARHRGYLLKAASRFKRGIGVSGVGLSLQEAFQGCIGEGIEYLSQLQTGKKHQPFPNPKGICTT